MSLIECVPNFSEGRDIETILRITDAISCDSSVSILGSDVGVGANRTVITFVGSPDQVLVAAFRAIERAANSIDMRLHHGEHQRIGATDVFPFIPLEDAAMQECILLAREVGARVGSELKIPVYLYGAAATRKDRQKLADVRRGEYEGLASRLLTKEGTPDFGPQLFNARTGATVVGAREVLIAWNVNLDCTDAVLAERIAEELRESGGPERDERGITVRSAIHIPGRFKKLQARGWFMPEYGCAQVSFNLLDYRISGLYEVFEACRVAAAVKDVRINGSELVGLVPLQALLSAGTHFVRRPVGDAELVDAAIQGLGLSSVRPFDPSKQVIEYSLDSAAKRRN